MGEWQEFSLYLIYLFLPLAQFGIIITQLGQASASATRVFEILDTQSDITEKPEAADSARSEGAGDASKMSPSATSAAASRC